MQKKNSFSLYSNFILNLCIVYELNNWLRILSDNFVLKNFLFGTVKLTINTDKSKFIYNGRGITFDGAGKWNFVNGYDENVVICGVDDISSSHTDDKKINYLVLGE